MPRLLLVLGTLTLVGACRTTAEQAPVGLEEAVLHPAPATHVWRVEVGREVVGSVVRYEERTGAGRHVFAVRNRHDQDLGLIDERGRAWRLRPHADPELLGTSSVAEGAARILGREGASLVEVTFESE